MGPDVPVTPGSTPAPAADRRDALRDDPGHARTFVFTDVEGSTRLWERAPEAMRPALERHDAILHRAITDAGGEVVKTTGDGLMAVFGAPASALTAAIAAQQAFHVERWPDACQIRVRMGVHTGEAATRGGDFFGPAVNRAARVMAAGHGGQVLLSGATASLVAGTLPARTTLRDLGEHRLKDLERPERLYQLVHPDLAAEFPPLATLDRRPNNLPTQASAFVGRETELQGIRERLDDPKVRLLTLTGPGGTGKTRLALRAAADQIDRFTHGVFLVDLAAARDTDAVVALVARAVGLEDQSGHSPVDELRRRLRPQQLLLVLDNFEQVTVAAPTLVELLNDCPDLKLLVTSREALSVRGEHLFTVPPLSLPEDARGASAADVSQFEAIQLFVERARAVKGDFHLTDDNAAAVLEICRRLDGLPLAIELATARIALFPPEALRERLGSRLKGLGGGARDLPARQQTLRATIDWSYQLLEPGEQRLLELLSIFAGSGIEAVEAVAADLEPVTAGGFDVIDGLSSLVNKSLIRQTTETGDARFGMLETIREFTTERLAASPEYAAAAHEAHAAYFAALAADAWASATAGRADDPLASVARDLDNLRVAWRHGVQREDRGRLAQLADPLWHILERRGWYHATIELIRDELALLAKEPESEERWRRELTLRTSLARAIMVLRGYTGEVEDAYHDALALFEGQRELPQIFPVLRSLASFHGYRGEFDKSIRLGREILRLAETTDDPRIRMEGAFVVGSYLTFTGDLRGGLAMLDEAIATFRDPGFRPGRMALGNDPRVSCMTTTGFLLWLLGFPDRAVERADEGVAIARQLDHPYSLAYALFHSGFLHVWRREPERVRDRALEVLRVVERTDLPIWRAMGSCLLGAAISALGDPTAGRARIADGLDQWHGLRTPPVFWPLILYLQALGSFDAGTADTGLALMQDAATIAGPDEVLAPLFHLLSGDLWLIRPEPDPVAARAAYVHAHDVAAALDAPMPQLRAATRLARIAGSDERAERLLTLRGLYDRITEGRDTPDLREARELLEGA
jgi:predicted ATPase/class 3 adenylate cyclase